MGVRFNREYEDILKDFTEALASIEDSAAFVEMEVSEWKQLKPIIRKEIAQTIADDLFFALGEDAIIDFGQTKAVYDPTSHEIALIKAKGEKITIKLI